MSEFFMHAPEVTAITAEVGSASEFARGQQEADQFTVARWTLDRRAPVMAWVRRANTTAPVFNDEEKRARATTQVRKVAREGYRLDVGGLALWARCYSATTLVAGARHVGMSWSAARNVPLSHKPFAPNCGASGRLARQKSGENDPFRPPRPITHGPTGVAWVNLHNCQDRTTACLHAALTNSSAYMEHR